jgi:hypothetical protein
MPNSTGHGERLIRVMDLRSIEVVRPEQWPGVGGLLVGLHFKYIKDEEVERDTGDTGDTGEVDRPRVSDSPPVTLRSIPRAINKASTVET